MIIDLKPLFIGEQETISLQETFDFSDEVFGGEKWFRRPVTVDGKIFCRAEVVTISAVTTAVFSGSCDRCGCEMEKTYTVKTNRDIVTKVHSDGNDDLIVAEDMKLDLSELIFGELVLNLPMKHLCKEDCLGVCQTCGANLNEGPCGCKRDEMDPRLAALQELLK